MKAKIVAQGGAFVLGIFIVTLAIIGYNRGTQWLLSKFFMMFIPNSMIGSSVIYLQLARSPELKQHKIFQTHSQGSILTVILIAWVAECFVASLYNALVPLHLTSPTRWIIWGLQLITLTYTVRAFKCKVPRTLELLLMSYPHSIAYTTSFLAAPFLIFYALMINSEYIIYLLIAPLIASIISLYITVKTRSANHYSKKHIISYRQFKPIPSLSRLPLPKYNSNHSSSSSSSSSDLPIRIVQLTDLHIGAMMTVKRLKYICEQVVKLNPDLVLITGDFFTWESYAGGAGVPRGSTATKEALSPLLKLKGRCYACWGNHDKEDAAPEILIEGLEYLGIKVLVNEAEIITLQNAKVQLIGIDYFNRNRQTLIPEIMKRFPRPDDVDHRLVMLHDPGAFKWIDREDGCIVFSGHTHGGQIGWMYGFHISLVSLVNLPDNGFWGLGRNRLYVHRGQGTRALFTNVLLRVGIPNEESIFYLYKADKEL